MKFVLYYFFDQTGEGMNRQGILDIVTSILVQYFQISPTVINEHSEIRNDLGIDSVSAIELTQRLEEQFGISLPDEEMGETTNLKILLDFLQVKIEMRELLLKHLALELKVGLADVSSIGKGSLVRIRDIKIAFPKIIKSLDKACCQIVGSPVSFSDKAEFGELINNLIKYRNSLRTL